MKKKHDDPKFTSIPYYFLDELLGKVERRINEQIERNDFNNPRLQNLEDIPRKAMHSGKFHAHSLDATIVADMRAAVEKFKTLKESQHENSPANETNPAAGSTLKDNE